MQEDNKRKSGRNLSLYIFECVMSVMYLGMSYILLFTGMFGDAVSNKNVRSALGIILGIYGIFRVYRAVKKFLN